jgi:hypothetical protein
MGDDLYPADPGNPKGYFESPEVNGINEGLLSLALPRAKQSLFDKVLGRNKPDRRWNRWLSVLAPECRITPTPKLANRIKGLTSRPPFCYKDPRFCYTLGAWREFVENPVFLCVFRHPSATADSIVKEQARRADLGETTTVIEQALRVWQAMYTYVLEVHYPIGGDWLFLHYDQLIDGTSSALLGKRLGVELNTGFVEAGLRRSRPRTDPLPPEVERLYRKLSDLAGYNPAGPE